MRTLLSGRVGFTPRRGAMRLLSGRSRLRCSRRLVTVFATLALSTHTAVAQRATSGRPETAGASCRQTVFAGLAVDCNLNGAGSELACCATLRGAEQNRCFCDAELVTLVSSVIGEQGLNFFRQFALERCGTRLTENDACFANSGVREGNGNFGAAQQVLRPVQATQVPSVETPQEDYEYEAGDGDTAPVTDTPGLIPPPVSNVLPGQQEGTVPGFPPRVRGRKPGVTRRGPRNVTRSVTAADTVRAVPAGVASTTSSSKRATSIPLSSSLRHARRSPAAKHTPARAANKERLRVAAAFRDTDATQNPRPPHDRRDGFLTETQPRNRVLRGRVESDWFVTVRLHPFPNPSTRRLPVQD